MSVVYEVEKPRRSVVKLIAMLIAGAAGVASALVADFVQKGDASAIIVMNSFVNQSLNLNLPLGYVALLLLGAGALSVFVFEPATKRAAYYTGASILAVLMTTMPVDQLNKALPLFEEIINPTNPDGAAFLDQGSFSDNQQAISASSCLDVKANGLPLIKATYSDGPATRVACSTGPTTGQAKVMPVAVNDVNVTVVVALPNGKIPRISARLHDDVSGDTWRLTGGRAVKTDKGYIVRYSLSIPITAAQNGMFADLHVRCEIDGFKIAHEHQKVTKKGPVVIILTMKKSSTPLWLQKLNTPYHF